MESQRNPSKRPRFGTSALALVAASLLPAPALAGPPVGDGAWMLPPLGPWYGTGLAGPWLAPPAHLVAVDALPRAPRLATAPLPDPVAPVMSQSWRPPALPYLTPALASRGPAIADAALVDATLGAAIFEPRAERAFTVRGFDLVGLELGVGARF